MPSRTLYHGGRIVVYATVFACLSIAQLSAYEQGSYFICKLVNSLDEKAPAKRLVAEKQIFKSSTHKKTPTTQSSGAYSLSSFGGGGSESKSALDADFSFGEKKSSDSDDGSLGFSGFGSGSSGTISSSSNPFGN